MCIRNKKARRKAQKLSVCGPSKGQVAWEKSQAKVITRRKREAQVFVSSYNNEPCVFVPFYTKDGVKQINRRDASRQYRRKFYDALVNSNGQ